MVHFTIVVKRIFLKRAKKISARHQPFSIFVFSGVTLKKDGGLAPSIINLQHQAIWPLYAELFS